MASPATESEARAVRARTLAGRLAQSSEPLTFYASLVTLQDAISTAHPRVVHLSTPFAEALDPEAAADAMPMLAKGVLAFAPPPVAAAARALVEEGHAEWRHLLHTYWAGQRDGAPLRLFLAEALLQPFAESAASPGRDSGLGIRDSGFGGRDSGLGIRDSGFGVRDSSALGVGGDASPRRVTDSRGTADQRTCQICGDRPVVAVLREEGHGARRSLICGFCLTEWPAPRIACLQCGEQQFDKLAVYRAEELPGVRVDACDTCRTYVKTVDLTRDATAIPVVDEIASLALDLWARQQGYQRLRPNLLRL